MKRFSENQGVWLAIRQHLTSPHIWLLLRILVTIHLSCMSERFDQYRMENRRMARSIETSQLAKRATKESRDKRVAVRPSRLSRTKRHKAD